jgi:hypothetical protein
LTLRYPRRMPENIVGNIVLSPASHGQVRRIGRRNSDLEAIMRVSNAIRHSICAGMMIGLLSSAAPVRALDVGAGASVGGDGVSAGAGASLGGNTGLGAGASVGDGGIGAGLGASVNGPSGVDAGAGLASTSGEAGLGAGLSVGGSSGLNAGSVTGLGGSGLDSTTPATLGGPSGRNVRTVVGAGGTSGVLLGASAAPGSAVAAPGSRFAATPGPGAPTGSASSPDPTVTGGITSANVRQAIDRLGPGGGSPAERAAMKRECGSVLSAPQLHEHGLVSLCRVLAGL